MTDATGNEEDKEKNCTGLPECASLHKKVPDPDLVVLRHTAP